MAHLDHDPMTLLRYSPVAGIHGLWAGPYLADLFTADSLLIGLLQFLTGRLVSAQPDTAAPATYQILFATYAVFLSVALLIYVFATDAPPNKLTNKHLHN